MGMMDFAAPAIEADSTSISAARRNANKTNNEFDINDFYYLMAAQLKNQDMMNPVDDSQFLAQMTQMAMIQAMDQMNEMTMTSYAFEFMGKDVIIALYDDNNDLQTIEGQVEKVTLYNGKPQVVVDGKSYDLSQVMEVVTPESENPIELIGREVAFADYDEEGNFVKDEEGKIVTTLGIIEKVTFYDGKIEYYIGGKAYVRDQILEIMPMEEKEDVRVIWSEDMKPDEDEELKDADKTNKTEGGSEEGNTTGGNDNEENVSGVTPPAGNGEGNTVGSDENGSEQTESSGSSDSTSGSTEE